MKFAQKGHGHQLTAGRWRRTGSETVCAKDRQRFVSGNMCVPMASISVEQLKREYGVIPIGLRLIVRTCGVHGRCCSSRRKGNKRGCLGLRVRLSSIHVSRLKSGLFAALSFTDGVHRPSLPPFAHSSRLPTRTSAQQAKNMNKNTYGGVHHNTSSVLSSCAHLPSSDSRLCAFV